jgi:hypothetical protein
MFYNTVSFVINYARFGYNGYNPQIIIRRSFISHWPMKWLDLIILIPQRSSRALRRIRYRNSNVLFEHDRHSTVPHNYLRLQVRNKHKYVPL